VATLDHLILTVNDRDASVRFSTETRGFGHEGEDGPFSIIGVSPDTTLQLAPWGTEGAITWPSPSHPRSSTPPVPGCGRPRCRSVTWSSYATTDQAGSKTGIVNSSEMGWNVTRRGMPTCSSSKGQSTTLVIMRGPSARSTMAAT
jgi:hypothetical protein